MKVWMVILQGFECLVKTQKKKETLNVNGKSLVSPVSPDFPPKSKLSHQPKKDILFTKKIVKKHWFEWYPPQKKMAFPVACHLRYLSTAKRRVQSGEDDVVPSLVQLQVLVLQKEKKQQQRWPSRSSAAVAVSLKQRRLAKWATEEQVPNPGLLPSTQFSANSQLTKT